MAHMCTWTKANVSVILMGNLDSGKVLNSHSVKWNPKNNNIVPMKYSLFITSSAINHVSWSIKRPAAYLAPMKSNNIITKKHPSLLDAECCRLTEAGRWLRKWNITDGCQKSGSIVAHLFTQKLLGNVRGSTQCHSVEPWPFQRATPKFTTTIKHVLSSPPLFGSDSPALLCAWHLTVCGCLWSL